MEQIRSFIAIELPEEIKRELSRLEEKLQSAGYARVKWVDPAGIHLTLKFLGNIATDKIDAITAAIEKATQGIGPFNLIVKDLGAFPHLRRVQVAWTAIGGETDKLNQLQQGIESNLVDLGFERETRPFTSHLTLARLRNQVSTTERQQLGQLLASTPFQAGSFVVNTISLMRSQLQRTGAVHSRISSVSLSND